jgi:hypothetical protein
MIRMRFQTYDWIISLVVLAAFMLFLYSANPAFADPLGSADFSVGQASPDIIPLRHAEPLHEEEPEPPLPPPTYSARNWRTEQTERQCVLYYLEPLAELDNARLRRIIPPMLPMWISSEMQWYAEPVKGSCFYPDCALDDARTRNCIGVLQISIYDMGQLYSIDVEYRSIDNKSIHQQSVKIYDENMVDLAFRRLFRSFATAIEFAEQIEQPYAENSELGKRREKKRANANIGLRPNATFPLNSSLAGLDNLSGAGFYLWFEPEDYAIEFHFDYSTAEREFQEKPEPLHKTERKAYLGLLGVNLHHFLMDTDIAPYIGGGGGFGWMKSEIDRHPSGEYWDPTSQTSVTYDEGYDETISDDAYFLDAVIGLRMFRSYNAGLNLSARGSVLFSMHKITPSIMVSLGFQFQPFVRCVP